MFDYTPEAQNQTETLRDLTELNLSREISFTELIEKIKSLVGEDLNKIYNDQINLKDCLVSIRRITCRSIKLENKNLINYNIHLFLIEILIHYQSQSMILDGDIVIIVYILFI